jgi:hypothetical protein
MHPPTAGRKRGPAREKNVLPSEQLEAGDPDDPLLYHLVSIQPRDFDIAAVLFAK